MSIQVAVIGEGSLLLSCLNILRENIFSVSAVFSESTSVTEYCEKEDISVFPRGATLEDVLSFDRPDYVFSINNPRILKEKEIRIPKILAVNYHDSFLPSYSGVNSTSWALINGEATHGVSWHVIETEIDTGDILKSEKINILADDTAFTLNLKCQEAAAKTFTLLLKDIRNDGIKSVPQDLARRSYYGVNQLLPNMGVLQFDTNCDTIYNFIRALEYGHHDNRLGVPKVLTSTREFLLVKSAELYNSFEVKTSAGVIVSVKDETILVATETLPIMLHLSRLDGSPIPPKKFKELALITGQHLESVCIRSDNDSLVAIRKREAFWVKTIKCYEPLTFFRQKMNVLSNIIDVSDTFNIQKTRVCTLEENIDLQHYQALFLGFLARVCCVSDISIGFLSNKSAIPTKCQKLYADICPCNFNIRFLSNTQDSIQKLKTDLTKHHIDKPFLKDLCYRYPDVNKTGRSPFHNLVIGQDSHGFPRDIFNDCNMLVLFSTHGRDLTVVYNKKPGQNYGHIVDTLRHFPTFVSSVATHKGLQLSDISLVSDDEMKMLYTPSQTSAHQISSITEEIEKRCTSSPNVIALKSTKHGLTYQEFFEIVIKLSLLINKTLKQYNASEIQILAIHLRSSATYVISLFAASKCGLTFMPLPVEFPYDRVKFAMSDANARFMLTSEEIVSSEELLVSDSTILFNVNIGKDRLMLLGWNMSKEDRLTSSVLNQSSVIQSRPGCGDVTKQPMLEEKIFYVMYTSGSTGKPKGVQVKELSVINMVKAQIDKWELTPSDVTAQFASIGFDASISEIFTSLLSGGTLAILDRKQRLGKEFISAMNMLGVTTITLTPSILNIYSPSDLPCLRNVITAGEACTLNIAMKWTKETGIHLFNAYGPTETTVCATMFAFNTKIQLEDANKDLPIGHAIPGVHVYLFDAFMKPVPPETVGQIYIGGQGLSAGYIGHASDRNQENFVQNPLTTNPDTLYRTGDHGFWENDGTLTYVGRMDDQVKIRGQRVDLNEVEQVLIQHIMVQVAVVVVHRCSRTGESVLVAFVAPDFVFLSELREYLATVLPKYMIPTYIKKIKSVEFPTTLNGKIDKTSLAQDESVHDQQYQIGHSHLNEIQLGVAKMWCYVLRLEESYAYNMCRVSSFFELGGNSLHLILLQRSIEERFAISLSFTDIGSADTIEEFADVIKKKKDVGKTSQQMQKQSGQLKDLIISDSQVKFDASRNTLFGIGLANESSLACGGKKIPMTILISGVTGFLGAFLLYELLECTIGNICCMVRESTEVKGFGKLVENMRKYNLWKYEYRNRLAIVLCDLTEDKLGIAPNIYNSLTNDVDAIFINAAMMNFNGSYEDHRQANVMSTQEFVKFAITNKRKYLFMTSSLSVLLFPNPHKDKGSRPVLMESDCFEDPTMVEGGYGQSKWASERLVMQALDFLPGGAIFRPARISGTSTDGQGPVNDLFSSILIGMKKLGSFPNMDFPFDLAPVDFCAKAIIEIACKIRIGQGGGKQVFHIFNKETIPFREIFINMDLRALPLGVWRKELLHAAENNKELLPLTPFFLSEFWDRARHWPVFDTTNTDLLISDNTNQLLKHSRDLLQIYKEFLKL